MIMGISGHFLTERKPLGTMKTRDAELQFAANPRLVNAAGERVEPFAGPVAILVDSMTGSASECFAGGMQSISRARVFGQTSMGQALPALLRQAPERRRPYSCDRGFRDGGWDEARRARGGTR